MKHLVNVGKIDLVVLLILWFFTMAVTPETRAVTLYVTPAGNDANAGLAWDQPKKTVTAALTAAVAGDQIWVATGTYYERITLKPGVALYGGFTGAETDLAQRNFTANPTILDGQKGGSVVTSPSGADNTARIDGFTIRNGIGTLVDNRRYGGGIYCSSSSPAIINNTISGNNASEGGGIYCSASSSVIANNIICKNTADGIRCNYSSTVVINNMIHENTGGGIRCISSSTTIRNNIISRNIAVVGGGIYCWGGSAPSITNNLISGNYASNSGGAFYCNSSSPSIISNTICGNSAYTSGGGISLVSFASPLIANNIIAFNGTGIFNDYEGGGTPVLRNNCVFNPGGANYTNLTMGSGDINSDPKLEAPMYGKYHLKSDSPCLDTGNDADTQSGQLDMDGDVRIVGDHVDIGADEYDGTAYPFAPSIFHVSLTGNDANDGSSWAQAKRSVQAGIDAATVTGGEVWVAEGTYYEQIDLKVFSYLYGGFAGTETQRDQRNFKIHTTTLNGLGGSVVSAITCGYQLSRIDGFTIRNGSADWGGGGIYCASSPAIYNNTITDNFSDNGGGIYCDHSSPVINGNTIHENHAYYSGAGIYCTFASPTICNNTICDNLASGGYGGIHCYSQSSPSIANNIIAFNETGIGVDYGNGNAPVLRNNCVFNSTSNYYGIVAGPTDIQVDPLFVDRARDNFHLTAASPCRDAGNDADTQPDEMDMDGEARIGGDHVDMGADECYLGPVITGIIPNSGLPTGSVNITSLAGAFFQPGATVKLCKTGQGDINALEVHVVSSNQITCVLDLSGAMPGTWDIVVKNPDTSSGTLAKGFTVVRTVVYVSPAGNDANPGTSWSQAKQSVTAGLNAALAGDQVWVAAGIYNERIVLTTGVGLFGGFAGTETNLSQRNIKANLSVLDGQAAGSVVTSPFGASATTQIDGFTIRNGTGTLVNGSLYGGGVYCLNSSPTISHNTICDNNASNGGGIYGDQSSAILINNTICGNHAVITGGGIYFTGSSPIIRNNIISQNTANYAGGGILSSGSSPAISNNTIVGNSASSYAGAIYCDSSSTLIINNIIAFNSTGIYCGSSTAFPVLRNNCVCNSSSNYSGLSAGTGDIQQNPRFVNRTGNDFHLTVASPCRDAGSDSDLLPGWSDLDGQTIVYGSHVDIGVDEWYPTPGDINGDTIVDVFDLGILAANYGRTSGVTWASGDFNFDGKVDVSDLGLLAANYGSGTGHTLDFNQGTAGLDLTAKIDTTPASSPLACGSAGLPLLAALALAGLFWGKLTYARM